MKVLFVHEGYISEHNGEYYSAPYNNEIINRYKTLADEIVFLTRKEPYKESNKKYNKLEVDGFEFIGVENFKSIKGINKYPKVKETVRKAVRETDYLIARIPGDLGNLAIKYAQRYNKKYVIELVGCAWDALWNYSNSGKLFAPFLYFNTKRIVRRAPHVIYVSSQFLQDRYPTNGLSTNCSNVSLMEVDPNIIKYRANSVKDLKSKSKIVLGTAAVVDVRYKGQQFVIKAISQLVKNGYNFEYQIVGSGDNSYLKTIVKKYNVEDHVVFIGSLPHAQVFQWLDNVDIYIQPSVTEGLPRALIEAMSRACICIGSNVGGIPELLPKGNIFNKADCNSLEQILIEAVENGHSTVEDTFNESKNYSKNIIEDRRKAFLLDFATKESIKRGENEI